MQNEENRPKFADRVKKISGWNRKALGFKDKRFLNVQATNGQMEKDVKEAFAKLPDPFTTDPASYLGDKATFRDEMDYRAAYSALFDCVKGCEYLEYDNQPGHAVHHRSFELRAEYIILLRDALKADLKQSVKDPLFDLFLAGTLEHRAPQKHFEIDEDIAF